MSKKWEERHVSLGATIVTAAITLAVGLVIGLNWDGFMSWALPQLGFRSSKPSASSTLDWSSLNDVYSTLSAKYYDGLDTASLIEGAKTGLVAAVGDEYTAYMDKDTATEYMSLLHGDAGSGIGIEFALRDNHLRVLRVLDDNPAKKAGIKAGDLLYSVDGDIIYSGVSSEEASIKLHGPSGTNVEVVVVRDGKRLTFNLVRETINNVSYYVNYSDDIAIITLTRFDDDTGTLVKKYLESDEYKSHHVKKIILDLRNNTGGYVTAAKDILSLWLDGDLIVKEKGKSFSDDVYANRNQAALSSTPTVVLVNEYTASASEIVASALKHYHKATVIGTKTYGKGVVQELINMAGGGILKVTTARWYAPDDTCIDHNGITPDTEIELTIDDLNKNLDPQLDAAKKALK